MRRSLAILLAALAAGLGGIPVAALAQGVQAAPRPPAPLVDPLSADPLERAALLALPSVYRVEVGLTLQALRTREGTRVALPPSARELRESGAAIAVAPGGYLVAAAHVADPDPERVAADAYRARLAHEGHAATLDEARAWARRVGARPVGLQIARDVRQADAGAGARESRSFTPQRVATDRDTDLTILRIAARAAPSLALSGSATIGTPVVTIGFGQEPAFDGPPRGELRPALRSGELGRSGDTDALSGTALVEVTTGVRQGDSGGPAIDRDGAVRGLVLFRSEAGGLILRASEIRAALAASGIEAGPNETAARFRAGMERFWALDLGAAAADLNAVRDAFPAHTLAGPLSVRAAALAEADYRLGAERRAQGFLLALGALSAAGALACGLRLALGARARQGAGAGRRRR